MPTTPSADRQPANRQSTSRQSAGRQPSNRPSTNAPASAGQSRSGRNRRRTSGSRNGQAQAPAAPKPSLFDQAGVTAVDPAPFDSLGLPTRMVRELSRAGLTEAFPIQAATIPDALGGRDVLGRARTGSGKTLAFGLPMLARLDGSGSQPQRPRGLVLVPTRELATQVTDSLKTVAKALGLYVREIVGGMSFSRQADTLRRGVDVIVATPGRLNDHVRQGTCSLDEVELTTLDEADQMADMGFLPQIRELLDRVPDGQRLLFSATLDGDVDRLVRRYMTDPVVHSMAAPADEVDRMEHHQLDVSAEDKHSVLTRIAARDGRTILFVRTKHNADRLTKKLRSAGVRAGALHGGKAQNARTRILDEFREGSTQALVATNVAARGIHVDDVSLVVHVEPPADPKDYLHRAGRTARAGATGTVVTLVTDEQRRDFRAMTGKAGVTPTVTRVTPAAESLARLTGAREPSGVAVSEPKPQAAPSRSRGKPGRPGQRGDSRARQNGDGQDRGRNNRGGGQRGPGHRDASRPKSRSRT